MGTLDSLLEKYEGNLKSLMAKFEATGAGKSFRSWVGTGENEPITADQIKNAFGRDLDELAGKLGMGKDQAADEIAQKLPDAVDKATPNGEIPGPEEVKKSFSETTS